MITWNLPANADNQPGAVIMDITGDSNRLWFVTRLQEPIAPRVYRVEFGSGKKINDARWTSWSLEPGSGFNNGIRRIKTSSDKRYVFVHSDAALQRVDTQGCAYSTTLAGVGCTRTIWVHNLVQPEDPNLAIPGHGSDVAIDDFNNVFTAIASELGPDNSFIQRLSPHSAYGNVTRWYVGGSAGLCPTTLLSTPCLSGVAIDRRSRDLVYYSEPTGGPDGDGDGVGDGAIAELNTKYNTVRRWFFSKLGALAGDPTVHEPRQLVFDNNGTLWAVTGSGHLVSLDPRKNRMSKHRMPSAGLGPRDPFGVAPDGGLIGFTDAVLDDSRVGMLMPDRQVVSVGPVSAPVTAKTYSLAPIDSLADSISGSTRPTFETVTGQVTRNEDGTWSEANTSTAVKSDGNVPLGVIQDLSGKQGTLFFALGNPLDLEFNRIGRVRLPKAELRGHDNRDDDDCDDDGKRADADDDVDDDGIKNAYDPDSDNDGILDSVDDDDDDDGIEDSFDTKDKKERKQTSEQDVASGGYSESFFTLTPGTLLAVASAVSTDPLAAVKIEIVDAAGTVVASSLSAVGAAALTWVPPAAGGDFTMRVKNTGLGTSTISTKLLTRELYSVLF